VANDNHNHPIDNFLVPRPKGISCQLLQVYQTDDVPVDSVVMVGSYQSGVTHSHQTLKWSHECKSSSQVFIQLKVGGIETTVSAVLIRAHCLQLL